MTITVLDEDGADDEPGQKDLNAALIDLTATTTTVAILTDVISISGLNLIDVTALFDADGDGNADYAFTVTVDAAGTVTSARLYDATATDDSAVQVAVGTTYTEFVDTSDANYVANPDVLVLWSTTTDVFGTRAAAQADTDMDGMIEITLPNTLIGGGTFLNAASYPSGSPTSAPSDTILGDSIPTDLSVSLSDGVLSVNPDGTQTYDYVATVENEGPGTATGVSLFLETDTALTPTAPGGVVLNPSPGVFVWENLTLNPGDAATFTVSYPVAAGTQQPTISSTAYATSEALDFNPLNDSQTDVNDVILPQPSLNITKTAQVLEADGSADPDGLVDSIGDQVVYTYTVSNIGDGDATSVTLIDDNGTPSDAGDDFSVPLTSTTLTAGSTEVVTVTMNFTAEQIEAGVPIVNTATLSSDQGEGPSASATVGVLPPPPPPPPVDPVGTANTHGFWKNKEGIANGVLQDIQMSLDTEYEILFDVEDVTGNRRFPDEPTLAEALWARGGGEGKFLRMTTAAALNALADETNYVIDEDQLQLKFGIGDSDPDNDDPDGLALVLATLQDLDLNNDTEISFDEIKAGVQEVFSDGRFDRSEGLPIAEALDCMNNYTSVDKMDFL